MMKCPRRNVDWILMPIEFQMKNIFELPNVFKSSRENAQRIMREGKLNHFINCEVWKQKMLAYDDSKIKAFSAASAFEHI